MERLNRHRASQVVTTLLLASALCTAGRRPIVAQHAEGSLPHDFDESISIYQTVLGTFSKPISSSNAEAQAYFNQGYRLMYAFARAEAGRSFREAQRRDPQCAICYWGEAWAWGPYISEGRTPEHEARAYAAIQKASSLAEGHANPKERAFIAAMATRYTGRFDEARKSDEDRAYANAMAKLVAAYPDDLDAATLYAEALFLLLPRPGAFDIHDPSVARVLSVLEAALKRDIRHPGACHIYVHTTELTREPQRAEPCVEYLGNAMPGASHLNHMPAHTWTRVGRWGDAVRASLQAWQSDQKASKGEGILTYPAHDLQMLVYAAAFDGQSAPSISAARGIAKLTGDPMYFGLALVRFGRFQDITTMGGRPSGDIAAGVWDFAQGYAQLRAGNTQGARQHLKSLSGIAGSSKAVFKIHSAQALLGPLAAILDGEIARSSGDLNAAIAAFEKAVALDDAIVIDDPEPLPFPARHWLGAALVDAKRFADAERVYRADLVKHPHNGWALTGLQLALKGQGKKSTSVDADLRSSWARSDTPIQSSRF
jgi:tetratricopeptide (TPR) repeat protein